jgi:hypothetical protein
VKKMLVRLIVAAILLAAGEGFRRAASVEERLATAEERLTTQTASVTPASYDEVEQTLSFATSVPVIGDRILRDVRHERAVAAYWTGDYGTVIATARGNSAAADTPADTDPDLQFLAANASFRDTLRTRRDRPAVLRGLDESLRAYSDVLKAAPAHETAAYNYEFVSRLRNAVARGRGDDDIPTGAPPNMQGEEGSPPQGTKPPEFNVIVPMRPDERQEQFDAGESGPAKRRG